MKRRLSVPLLSVFDITEEDEGWLIADHAYPPAGAGEQPHGRPRFATLVVEQTCMASVGRPREVSLYSTTLPPTKFILLWI